MCDRSSGVENGLKRAVLRGESWGPCSAACGQGESWEGCAGQSSAPGDPGKARVRVKTQAAWPERSTRAPVLMMVQLSIGCGSGPQPESRNTLRLPSEPLPTPPRSSVLGGEVSVCRGAVCPSPNGLSPCSGAAVQDAALAAGVPSALPPAAHLLRAPSPDAGLRPQVDDDAFLHGPPNHAHSHPSGFLPLGSAPFR